MGQLHSVDSCCVSRDGARTPQQPLFHQCRLEVACGGDRGDESTVLTFIADGKPVAKLGFRSYHDARRWAAGMLDASPISVATPTSADLRTFQYVSPLSRVKWHDNTGQTWDILQADLIAAVYSTSANDSDGLAYCSGRYSEQRSKRLQEVAGRPRTRKSNSIQMRTPLDVGVARHSEKDALRRSSMGRAEDTPAKPANAWPVVLVRNSSAVKSMDEVTGTRWALPVDVASTESCSRTRLRVVCSPVEQARSVSQPPTAHVARQPATDAAVRGQSQTTAPQCAPTQESEAPTSSADISMLAPSLPPSTKLMARRLLSPPNSRQLSHRQRSKEVFLSPRSVTTEVADHDSSCPVICDVEPDSEASPGSRGSPLADLPLVMCGSGSAEFRRPRALTE
uniref:Uncharacterized protein n=1 Tax=Noctiluca scintillans TaxID=2966 RepID=A0A7S0ZVQ0_NOCSC|mmetsp:Transcript_20954/g.55906  ORF Transcript_20954/g.55906 Transcript_20954/m.55906 type:complete len:395 (+) Transcript_20954:50-1234(+)